MELNDLIKRDLNYFERKRYTSGKSKNELLSREFASIESINQIINKVELENPFKFDKNNLFMGVVFDYFDELYGITKDVINAYREMDFKFFYNLDCNLSMNDKKELLSQFLKYLGEPFYNLYKSLYDEGRVFIAHMHEAEGESYLIPSTNSYYIAISDCYNEALGDIESISHELGHIYATKFLSNYRTTKFNNLYNFYTETIPLLIELLFYKFLMDNYIHTKEIMFHRNNLDTAMLYDFKVIYYLYHILDRDNVTIQTNNVLYKIISQDEDAAYLDHFKDEELYSFDTDSYIEGSLQTFCYPLSSIEAHALLTKILNGENIIKVINDFLLSLTVDSAIDDKVNNTNINPYVTLVKERNEEIKRRYLI